MLLLRNKPADPMLAAKKTKKRGNGAACKASRFLRQPTPLRQSPAATWTAPTFDLWLRRMAEACQESERLAKAIDIIRMEAERMAEIDEVYRTRLGRFPTFIFITSNERYNPELDRKIMAVDRQLVDRLPDFRFDLLCFPRMKADPASLVPGDKDIIYRRGRSLHAPA